MHVSVGAAKIVLREGGMLRLTTGAIVTRGNKGEGVGDQADVAFVISLRAKEGVEGSVFRLKIEN